MSIEANTYEELRLNNINEKTKVIASEIGKYLKETWGIISLSLVVDGISFHAEDDHSLSGNADFQNICENLKKHQNIWFSLRSSNAGGLDWRMESSFLAFVDESIELRENLNYRSIDYYDQDDNIDMYLYDINGVQHPDYRFDRSPDESDRWFSYNSYIYAEDESGKNNAEIRDFVYSKFKALLYAVDENIDESEMTECIDDDWEDNGEMTICGSFSFEGTHIHAIANVIREIDEYASDKEIVFEANIQAVCDSPNKDFASVIIMLENNEVKIGYCEY